MGKLQSNFTTPEQSERLLALGVPANSADCYYIDSMTSFQDKSPHIISPDYKYSDGIPNGYESRFCPCWSVGRLMEIIDICEIDPKDEEYPTTRMIKDETKMNYIDYLVGTVRMMLPRLDFSKLESI